MTNRLGTLPLIALVLLLGAALVLAWRSGTERSPAPPDPTALAPSAHSAGPGTPANVHDRNGRTLQDPELVSPVDVAARGADDPRGFRVQGVVTARGGRPIEAAEVAIAIEHAGEAREIARARTASDGRYSIELAEVAGLDALERAGMHLRVGVRAGGWQPRTQRRSLVERAASAPEGRAITVDFELSAGRELSGRIVDAHGRPIGGAQVALIVTGEHAGRPARTVSAEIESARDGGFALGFVSSGHYELGARAVDVGTALVALDLEAGDERRLGDVVLRGTGHLSGRVHYPDRQPVQYVELWAIPESVSREGRALVETVQQAPLEERDDGLFYGRAVSDPAGRFQFAGLKPGRYALRSPKPDLVLEPRHGFFATGTDGIELAVHSYRLIVRVRDTAGRAVAGATVGCTEMTQLSDGELEPGRARHATASGPEAVATFEVEPETTLALSASAGGGREAEDLVIVAQNQYELAHELVIAPAQAPGRLRVVVSGPSGETVAPLDVALLSAATQRRIDQLGVLSTDEQGWLPPLPPGRYLLEVGTPADLRSLYFPIRSREVVEIESNAAREVFLSARIGGRLEIALDLAGRMPDDFVAPEPVLDPRERVARAEEHLSRRGAVARLVAQDGSAQALQFLVPSVEVEGRIDIASRLLPGDRAPVEALLEPGQYKLEVDALGFRHASLPVVVEAGRTSEVRVVLDVP